MCCTPMTRKIQTADIVFTRIHFCIRKPGAAYMIDCGSGEFTQFISVASKIQRYIPQLLMNISKARARKADAWSNEAYQIGQSHASVH